MVVFYTVNTSGLPNNLESWKKLEFDNLSKNTLNLIFFEKDLKKPKVSNKPKVSKKNLNFKLFLHVKE